MNSKTKKVTFIGVMTAFALVLAYVELLLPPIFATLPAIKIGLPNMAVLFLLYKFSFKEAALCSAVRIIMVALLFGNAVSLLYSLAGGLLSLVVMVLLKKSNLFSAVGVSVAGAVSHNLGQIIAAILILETVEIGYYIPVLIVSGTVAGVAVGLLSSLVLKYLSNKNFYF
ncbi:MAG: Gx transporter family protein [Ruminococcaceae bacterium]|nr:Gx transporter family protein [Oscillospiraceae bacterium]